MLAVEREQHGTIATSANYGTMMPTITYIIALIVVYAEKVGVLERTSSIAR